MAVVTLKPCQTGAGRPGLPAQDGPAIAGAPIAGVPPPIAPPNAADTMLVQAAAARTVLSIRPSGHAKSLRTSRRLSCLATLPPRRERVLEQRWLATQRRSERRL